MASGPYKLVAHELGFILFLYWGAMSQSAYLEEYESPPSPRSRPLRLPYQLEASLNLEDNPQRLDLGECFKGLHISSSHKTTKSSILQFLELKPKVARKTGKCLPQ